MNAWIRLTLGAFAHGQQASILFHHQDNLDTKSFRIHVFIPCRRHKEYITSRCSPNALLIATSSRLLQNGWLIQDYLAIGNLPSFMLI